MKTLNFFFQKWKKESEDMNHILDESYKQALKVNWSEKYVLRKF